MLSKVYGKTKTQAGNLTDGSAKMKHKEMFLEHIVRPFANTFHGVFDYLWIKFWIILAGLPALLGADLFETPSLWWKGLAYLVIFDWLAGTVNAVYRGKFDWSIWTKKLYMATGYGIVCAMAAILSNTFPEIFYYFQFGAYAAFFLKEFVSTLKTFRVLALFSTIWKVVITRDLSVERFEEFKKEVDKRSEQEPGTTDQTETSTG